MMVVDQVAKEVVLPFSENQSLLLVGLPGKDLMKILTQLWHLKKLTVKGEDHSVEGAEYLTVMGFAPLPSKPD